MTRRSSDVPFIIVTIVVIIIIIAVIIRIMIIIIVTVIRGIRSFPDARHGPGPERYRMEGLTV